MQRMLLASLIALFSCTKQSGDSQAELELLKQQNQLLKQQLTDKPRKEKQKPDLAPIVSGIYIASHIEDYINGKSKDLPNDGLSVLVTLKSLSKNQASFHYATTSRKLLGGVKNSEDEINCTLTGTEDKVQFKENWQKGPYEVYGTISDGILTQFTTRRSDGKLVSKEEFQKQ